MKDIFKKIITWKIGILARILLARTKPEVIAITGSAGKTSAKEFLAKILVEKYEVLAPAEGYNTEIGAPLALFGEKAPTKLFSVTRWLRILLRCFGKSLFMKNLPKKIIVEMGADKPGDIKYLCKIFNPRIGVILDVLPVHLEEFGAISAVAAEKAELAKALPAKGQLFLNYDDKNVRKMAKETRSDVIFFGTTKDSDFSAENIKSDLSGTRFKLKYPKGQLNLSVPLYGRQMVYPLLAALVVAISEGIDIKNITAIISKLAPFKGRMNILSGAKGSTIIDDSYNANPASTIEALNFLGAQRGRKIALLGNMNELGEYEQKGHEEVGKTAAAKLDLLITVGDVAKRYLAKSAEASGLAPEKIISFETSKEAGKWLKKRIKSGDIILAKGSQNNVRMENAVEQILADPSTARKVLVRQSSFWKVHR